MTAAIKRFVAMFLLKIERPVFDEGFNPAPDPNPMRRAQLPYYVR